jgi:hypothetical protein
MPQFFNALEERIFAVVCGGRGASGALGPAAQARSIPAGRFRTSPDDASVRDPEYPAPALDRAVSIEWISVEDDPDSITNEYDTRQLRQARFSLLVAYVVGPANAAFVRTIAGETAATAAAYPTRRALSDAERIRRALSWHGLVAGDGLAPDVVQLHRDGPTTVESLSPGVMLSVTPYRATLEVDITQVFDP